jgi:hypothetical protein
MIKIIEAVNWNTTRLFLKREFLLPVLIEPFSTAAGLNDER